MYYFTRDNGGNGAIIKVDTQNISETSLVVELGNVFVFGLTASPYCNSLLGFAGTPNTDYTLSLINLVDGVITHLCDVPPNSWLLTSMIEFSEDESCDVSLDLDRDDSSGAVDTDFNSSNVTCFIQEAVVADEDVL